MVVIYISETKDRANMQEEEAEKTISYLMRDPGNRSKPGESRIKTDALAELSKQQRHEIRL
jgi:hypothetical protein